MSYDALAPHYQTLERLAFGSALQKARCELLKTWSGPDPEQVLTLGDGDGRFLQNAVKRWPRSRFVAIDQSAGMQSLCRGRTPGHRIEYIHADVREALTRLEPQSFPVIVSHFFLDCFTTATLAEMVPALAQCLTPEGDWYISEFANATPWQKLGLWGMYRFFSLTTETEARTFPDYMAPLRANGLRRVPLDTWARGWVQADRWTPTRASNPLTDE